MNSVISSSSRYRRTICSAGYGMDTYPPPTGVGAGAGVGAGVTSGSVYGVLATNAWRIPGNAMTDSIVNGPAPFTAPAAVLGEKLYLRPGTALGDSCVKAIHLDDYECIPIAGCFCCSGIGQYFTRAVIIRNIGGLILEYTAGPDDDSTVVVIVRGFRQVRSHLGGG